MDAGLRKTDRSAGTEAEEQPSGAAPPAAEPQAELTVAAAAAEEEEPHVLDEEMEEAPAAEEPQAEAEEEVPAAELAAPPASGTRGRKSVRFDTAPAGTPEGAARDATITIRIKRGDGEQASATPRHRRPSCPACCHSRLRRGAAQPARCLRAASTSGCIWEAL